MFRSPVTIVLFLGCVLSAVACLATGQILRAEDQETWRKTEFKKLQGRWRAFCEEKTSQEKVHRQGVELEFVGGELKILMLDESGNPAWSRSLEVLGIESVGPVSRLILGSGEQMKAEVYYDFSGDKLILVNTRGRPS